MTDCPDLLAAIRDLHTAIVTLTDELRQHRKARQKDIEALIALHQRPRATPETNQSNSVTE